MPSTEFTKAELIALFDGNGGMGKVADWKEDLMGTLKQVWEDPYARAAIIGSGIGTGVGAGSLLIGKKKRSPWARLLSGAALGGLGGLGVQGIMNAAGYQNVAPNVPTGTGAAPRHGDFNNDDVVDRAGNKFVSRDPSSQKLVAHMPDDMRPTDVNMQRLPAGMAPEEVMNTPVSPFSLQHGGIMRGIKNLFGMDPSTGDEAAKLINNQQGAAIQRYGLWPWLKNTGLGFFTGMDEQQDTLTENPMFDKLLAGAAGTGLANTKGILRGIGEHVNPEWAHKSVRVPFTNKRIPLTPKPNFEPLLKSTHPAAQVVAKMHSVMPGMSDQKILYLLRRMDPQEIENLMNKSVRGQYAKSQLPRLQAAVKKYKSRVNKLLRANKGLYPVNKLPPHYQYMTDKARAQAAKGIQSGSLARALQAEAGAAAALPSSPKGYPVQGGGGTVPGNRLLPMKVPTHLDLSNDIKLQDPYNPKFGAPKAPKSPVQLLPTHEGKPIALTREQVFDQHIQASRGLSNAPTEKIPWRARAKAMAGKAVNTKNILGFLGGLALHRLMAAQVTPASNRYYYLPQGPTYGSPTYKAK